MKKRDIKPYTKKKSVLGFEDNKFTFPYYLTFLLKRFFKETEYIKWNQC